MGRFQLMELSQKLRMPGVIRHTRMSKGSCHFELKVEVCIRILHITIWAKYKPYPCTVLCQCSAHSRLGSTPLPCWYHSGGLEAITSLDLAFHFIRRSWSVHIALILNTLEVTFFFSRLIWTIAYVAWPGWSHWLPVVGHRRNVHPQWQ